MQTSVRTTLRLRKDLFDQSRLLAVRTRSSLQAVINDKLALGLRLSDTKTQHQAMAKIDRFRQSLASSRVNVKKIVKTSREELK